MFAAYSCSCGQLSINLMSNLPKLHFQSYHFSAVVTVASLRRLYTIGRAIGGASFAAGDLAELKGSPVKQNT